MAAKNTVTVSIVGDASSAQRAFRQVDDAGEKTGSKFGGLTKVAGVTGTAIGVGVLAALPGLHRAGNELETMAAKAETVFGKSVGTVEKWADKSANAMGLTERGAAGLAANFGDLLVPMGFTQEAAADMSTKVVGLSGALSAWSGGQRSAAEVSAILSKAMLGERDGLKELGISISEADVQGRLLSKGQQDLTGAALEQAKAVATSELIFEKSKDAQRAFADSTQTNAEKALLAKGRMDEFKDAIAVGLVPVFAVATEWGLKIIDWLSNLSPTTLTVIGVVGGLLGVVFLVTKAVQAWTAVQAALNVVMAMNPIGLIIVAVAALVAAFVWAYQNVDWFREGVQHVVGAIATSVEWLGKMFAAVWDAVWAAGTWLFDRLGGAVKGYVDFYRSVFEGIIGIAKGVFNAVARLWNSSVGKLSFRAPDWVPGIGGKGFDVPNLPILHGGGVVPGVVGTDVPILAQAGETVLPIGASAGATYNITVNAPNYVGDKRELASTVVDALRDFFARGGQLTNGRGGSLAPA